MMNSQATSENLKYMPSSLYFSMENKEFVSSLSSSTSSLSSSNNENTTYLSSDSNSDLSDHSNTESRSKLESLENELKDVRLKISKLECELNKEKSKLITSNLSIQRHSVNLFEWENMVNLKTNQLTIFVENFKLNVFYSNDTQLNKLLFKDSYFADLNSEIFDLQEKANYLHGVIRQLQSGVSDSQSRIEELLKKQETMRIKLAHLQNQRNRQVFKQKSNFN